MYEYLMRRHDDMVRLALEATNLDQLLFFKNAAEGFRKKAMSLKVKDAAKKSLANINNCNVNTL